MASMKSQVAHALTVGVIGVDSALIQVEAQIFGSLRRFSLVGLPDGVVREAKERVRCAIESSGMAFPHSEVIVNLSPAGLPKTGASFDLAIALAILAANESIPAAALHNRLFVAELALDGTLRRTTGAIHAGLTGVEKDLESVFLCTADAETAARVAPNRCYGAENLAELVEFLRGERQLAPSSMKPLSNGHTNTIPNFSDVIGQDAAKRALEIAAAGGHNLLFIGPPGVGKSLLARRIQSILPPLTVEEELEVLRIRSSLSPNTFEDSVIARPYRAPHHSLSASALVGGGSPPRPGEISLAHRGVLFLDELPEFRRDALEALRQPLEEKSIQINRKQLHLSLPADFQLIAAMNPCPCGHAQENHICYCDSGAINRYRRKVSGPLLDRMDLQLWLPQIPIDELNAHSDNDPTPAMRSRVTAARQRQNERHPGLTNSRLSIRQLKQSVQLTDTSTTLLKKAQERYTLSPRSYAKILRVSRTIADLNQSPTVTDDHLLEALSYRMGSL